MSSLDQLTERIAYREGFIAGAVIGADVEHAQWAIEHDMAAARELRDSARATGDPVLWRSVRYLVAEARMWNTIVRLLRGQEATP